MSAKGHLGFFNTSSTRTHVRFQFSTHAAAGGNVAPSSAFEAADIRIYRANDGAAFSATQRSSANGITMTSPFDSLTGVHDIDIDLTDNTDAGFYAAGYMYSIVLAPDETVDSQTITGIVLATFEIGVVPVNVTQNAGTAITASSGRQEVNLSHIAGSAVSTTTAQLGVNVVQISADATAADNAESFFDGTGYAGTGNTIPTVTTLTNLPAITANWLTATGIAADAITAAKIADGAIDAGAIATGAITSAKFAAGAIDAAAIATDAITSAKIADGAIDAATFAAGAINAAAIASDAITDAKVAADVTIASVTGAVGSVTGNVGGNVTGSVGSIATGGITSGSFAAGAINNAAMSIDGSELTAVPWNSAWDAEVQSEVDDALIAKGLDHLVFTSVTGTDIADNSIIAYLASKSATADWDSYVNTTDSLEANRDNIGTAGAGLTAADDAVITAIGALNNITAASVWAVGTRTLTAGTNIDGSTFTAIPWNAAWDAEVQSEVDDALVAQRLDELLNADSDIDGAAPPTVGSVFHELMTKTAGSFTYDQTTDSLEAVRDRGDAAWTTATGFSTHTAADVWAVGTRVLTAGTNIQLPSNGLANVTAWTVDITGSLSGSVGSVTSMVTANVTQLSGDSTAADNAEAFFDGTGYAGTNNVIPLVTTTTTATNLTNAPTNGDLTATMKTSVTTACTASTPTVASVSGAVGSVTGNVGGNVTGSVGSLATQAKADVNAEVLDVLNVDTFAEVGQESPAATTTIRKMIAMLYKAWRNRKTQTATAFNLMADDGTTVDQKATVSDDGTTTTIGEITTGP